MFQYISLVKRLDVIRVLCVVMVGRTRMLFTARVVSLKACSATDKSLLLSLTCSGSSR
jgi:hypothetical protein